MTKCFLETGGLDVPNWKHAFFLVSTSCFSPKWLRTTKPQRKTTKE
jgi:hypothetical protein